MLRQIQEPQVSAFQPPTPYSQGTGTWFVALVNLAADEASKMLTHKYSPAELAYFRALVRSEALFVLTSTVASSFDTC